MVADPTNNEDPETIDWLIVGVHREEHAMYELLLSYAENVHMHGEPCPRFFNKIIAAAPNLKRVRVIPHFAHLVEPDQEAGKVLADNNIEVVIGTLVDKGPRKKLVAKTWLNKRYFLLRLDEEQKRMLADLQRHTPGDWELTSRYLCLNGEAHISLDDLAKERGMSGGHIQDAVGMVLYHLDAPFDIPLASMRKARVLQEKIEKGREQHKLAAQQLEKVTALDLTLADLPQGMSDDYLDEFAMVLREWRRDRLASSVTSREKKVLVRRYGLEDHQFRTLEEVGDELGVTRERIRQLETVAFRRLRTLEPKT